MMVRACAVLTLAAAWSIVLAGTAQAHCSCVTRTPQQHVSEAVSVFSGTVTDVRVDEPMLHGGRVTAKLRTDHVYKGVLRREFEVFTAAEGAACGFEFVDGLRYLVFARARGSQLTTTLCSGNVLLPAGQVTPESSAALGTPVSAERSSAPHWTGLLVLAAAVAVGVTWYRRTR
ncbi:hypothetical protein SAMN05421874_12188 [Nonomuraea maritima]|uniref:Tissue inhibitor of metalloproteinase n=1 Tax=Nonomuraea maritima TaxID=683260 RepID=A0A1G9K1M3_9ACTN|nr:hypothetical protein [Nonomuraea maritima]SDL43225.1 hypothetical protein SAMN05421874_12188 [Nonomuraea maritima]